MSMDLQKWQTSPIFITVRDIMNNQDCPYKSRLTCIIHTVDQDYTPYRFISEDFVRDYVTNMMDDNQVSVMIPAGDYTYLIYPNKDNLEMTITKTYLQNVGDMEDTTKPIEQIRYKCILDPRNPSFSSTDLNNYDQAALNNSQILTIKMRLMDRNIEPLRVKMTQGIFRGVTPETLIKSVILGESQQVQVDGQPAVTGIDVVPPDNTAPFDHVVLPSGTFVCEVPTMIQEKFGGVYKYGIGTYYQRYRNNTPTWFVYPLRDFDRFDGGQEQNVAIFYFAPQKYTTKIERTYRVNANLLEAIVTTDRYQHNSTDVTQLNDGVGFRMLDPNAFMKKPVEVDQSGSPVANRARLNTEVNFLDRADGLIYTPVVSNIGSNSYHEVSKVSARQTTIVQFGWQHSDESLLYPGMPVKMVYMQDDQVCELKGTLSGLHATRTREGTLGQPDRYLTNCILSVATERNTQLPTYDVTQSYDPSSSLNN